MQLVKIPEERVAVLLGEKGRDKRRLEKASSAKFKISEDGEVEIRANDPVVEWRAKDFVFAVGRGFSPSKAMKLANEDCYLRVIDLRLMFNTPKQINRVKGRIIGEEGRTRQVIEECADVDLCIYGHTVAMIGMLEEVGIAERAIQMLMEGAMHSTVYKMLEEGRRRLNESRMSLWEEKPR
ncbi:RNA-processing protein [Candidatus Micrarchaeota archaeon]|nr:MAG: RNA-processing protein [Candidatus Micrarchaeota archaeon]